MRETPSSWSTIHEAMSNFGSIPWNGNFPALIRLTTTVARLIYVAKVQTVDFVHQQQNHGGMVAPPLVSYLSLSIRPTPWSQIRPTFTCRKRLWLPGSAMTIRRCCSIRLPLWWRRRAPSFPVLTILERCRCRTTIWLTRSGDRRQLSGCSESSTSMSWTETS